jgi:hypothetical protein
MEISERWKKDNYLNKDYISLFGVNIFEYDMELGGFNIAREFGLLSSDKIKELEGYSKNKIHVLLGIFCKDKEYSEKQQKGFQDARKEFFIYNNIEDFELLSVKKDALFVLKRCKNPDKFKYINFVKKNFYTSYMNTGNLELYHFNHKIDVKGISDEMVELHKDGMLIFIDKIFNFMEFSYKIEAFKYIRKFVYDYREKNLPVEYYREFSSSSSFKTLDGGVFDLFGEEEKEELDISYNFIKVILPILKIVMCSK